MSVDLNIFEEENLYELLGKNNCYDNAINFQKETKFNR